MDERNNMERRSNNFLRSRDWSHSDGKIIYLESYVSCLRGSGWGGASAFQSWVRAPLARSWRNPGTVHWFPNIGLIKQSNTHTAWSQKYFYWNSESDRDHSEYAASRRNSKEKTGILMGAETIDQHGKSFILVVPDVSVYDSGMWDSLILAGRLMEAGYNVNFNLFENLGTPVKTRKLWVLL